MVSTDTQLFNYVMIVRNYLSDSGPFVLLTPSNYVVHRLEKKKSVLTY